ncbi:hypothetical protein [Streptomyces sp. CoH27]|uniref:hypothetical protein n=1 Tax=Streptomyces sp. CoH27 TaxID=2875763 RepID=UPI001CD1B2D4|nr:hypothetical protein [Streptomyces sp. CoH27]
MLEALGLDSPAERFYKAMLAHPEEGVAGPAAITGLPELEIRHGLDHLSALSLIYPSEQQESGFRTLSPDAAVGLVLARQQSDLTAAQMRLAASRAAAAQFVAECSTLGAPRGEPDSERLIGVEVVRERLSRLGASAEREVMTFAPGGAHAPEDLRASRAHPEQGNDRGPVRPLRVGLGHGDTSGRRALPG